MTVGKEFWVTPGMTILQSTFLHGDLTNDSYYSNEVLEMPGGRKNGGQATQAMLDEYAKLNNLTGIIAVSEGTAKAANSLTDPMEGTYIHVDSLGGECPAPWFSCTGAQSRSSSTRQPCWKEAWP
jgi:hypothetical protein